jgi:glycosyltransferase involved in cell wall biosynthesis
MKIEWPFVLLMNARHQPIRWALVNGPIVTYEQQHQFADLRNADYRFAGMSSYMTFPLTESDDPLDYEAICEAWCHCFREPDRFISSTIPRELISISDFTDQRWVLTAAATDPPIQEFDFIYVGALEDWKRETKNWPLASRCVPRLCRELGLNALVIGSPTDDFPLSPGVTFSAPLAWDAFLSCLSRAKFLLVPNELDASPRLLAEALSLNVPIVVNRNILGGWKYVNRFTGAFFEEEADVVAAARVCLETYLEPQSWFRVNHGPYLAGRRLLGLLKSVEPEISERSHLCILDGPIAML